MSWVGSAQSFQFAGGYYPSAGRVVIPDPTGERPTALVVATPRVDQHLVHAEPPRPHRHVEIQFAGGYYPHQAGRIFLALSGERPKRGDRGSIPRRSVSSDSRGAAMCRDAPCEATEDHTVSLRFASCRILLVPRARVAFGGRRPFRREAESDRLVASLSIVLVLAFTVCDGARRGVVV